MSLARRLWILRILGATAFATALFFTGAWAIEDYLLPGRIPYLGANVGAIGAGDVIELTNRERARKGLPPLTANNLLNRAAQLKAEDMAENEYYAHVGPDGRGPLGWLSEVGYRYLNAGENLVIDRTTPEAAVDAWMGSADHRANILRPQFTEIGVGVAQGRYKGTATLFVVQVFATPMPARPVVAPRTTSQSETPVRTAPRVEPSSSLPRLSAPALTATSTIPAPVDPLVSGVQNIVTPVTNALARPQPTPAQSSPVSTSVNRAGESTPPRPQAPAGRPPPPSQATQGSATSSSLSAVAATAPVAAMQTFSLPTFSEPITVEPVQLVLRATERGTEVRRTAEAEGWQAQVGRVIDRTLEPVRTFFTQVPTFW